MQTGLFPNVEVEEGLREKIKAKRHELQWNRSVRHDEIARMAIDRTKEDLQAEYAKVPAHKRRSEMTRDDVMRRWPALTAHMICESLGYATPECAANIILDAITGQENWCEWVASCYKCDPTQPLKNAIRTRHYHKGYMAEFKQALAIVFRTILTGDSPMFASWF